ncbi:hypothetical protein [Saccharopolyspora sp. NPDC002376]
MRIHRAFTYVGVWLAATTAAVTVTWLGVRDVIHGAVFDQPDPPPVARAVTVSPTEQPPPPEPPPTTTAAEPTTVDTPAPEVTTPIEEPDDAEDVRAYDVTGGTVVLEVLPERATLISATPRAGYTVQTWEQPGWLRVEFTTDGAASSLIATWHDGPTSVQTFEN